MDLYLINEPMYAFQTTELNYSLEKPMLRLWWLNLQRNNNNNSTQLKTDLIALTFL